MLASERCLQRLVEHSRLVHHIPDRCIAVADETHIEGDTMTRKSGRAPERQPLEAFEPDPRSVQRDSSIVATSSNRSIIEPSVNQVPPAKGGDDWAPF